VYIGQVAYFLSYRWTILAIEGLCLGNRDPILEAPASCIAIGKIP
jgi:hypothetical protein